MASSLEIFLGLLALIVDTLLILAFYFIYNTTFGPVLKFAGDYFARNPPAVSMAEISWVPSAIFAILLLLWFAIVISMVAILARRETVGGYYEGGL